MHMGKKRTKPCKCSDKAQLLTERHTHRQIGYTYMPVKCTSHHLCNLVEKKNLHLWVIFQWTPEGQPYHLQVWLCTRGCWISVNSRAFSLFFLIWCTHRGTCTHALQLGKQHKGWVEPCKTGLLVILEGTSTAAVPCKTLKHWLLK